MTTDRRSPAFQFYVKDWLADPKVRCLTFAQKGAYIDLLASMWDYSEEHCLIPYDLAKKLIGIRNLRVLTEGPNAVLLVDKSVDNPSSRSDQDYVSSSRLHEEANKQRSLSHKRRRAGKKGGEASAEARRGSA